MKKQTDNFFYLFFLALLIWLVVFCFRENIKYQRRLNTEANSYCQYLGYKQGFEENGIANCQGFYVEEKGGGHGGFKFVSPEE